MGLIVGETVALLHNYFISLTQHKSVISIQFIVENLVHFLSCRQNNPVVTHNEIKVAQVTA